MIEHIETNLPKALAHYGIFGSLGKITEGPLITEVEFKLAEGTKFANVAKMMRDIARELGITGIRAAEIPNSTYICFEVPNQQPETIPFPPILYSAEFVKANYALPICIGVNMRGIPLIKDLSKMPHLLVAGTTGSGKSVGLNSFILSLIHKKTPEELQFVLIDPKRIEFSMYNNQQYMYRPVITDMNEASTCLEQLVNEMNYRYTLFEQQMVRNISEYHEKGFKMPYIVCIIDEFSDLILFDKTVEKQVLQLAQKARAAGIHLIIATQRPSVDVITGTIKANLPTRLSYKVSSPTDSMTILNTAGAEMLLGRGDSLLLEENGTLTRILGAYVSNQEIMDILEPYRLKSNQQNFSNILADQQKQNQEIANQRYRDSLEAEKQKTLSWKIRNWWENIGKVNQRRIINFFLTIAMGIISGMTGSSSKKKSTSDVISSATNRAVGSVKRSIKAQAKKAVTDAVLNSLKKK